LQSREHTFGEFGDDGILAEGVEEEEGLAEEALAGGGSGEGASVAAGAKEETAGTLLVDGQVEQGGRVQGLQQEEAPVPRQAPRLGLAARARHQLQAGLQQRLHAEPRREPLHELARRGQQRPPYLAARQPAPLRRARHQRLDQLHRCHRRVPVLRRARDPPQHRQ
jgi:hypothetical protein